MLCRNQMSHPQKEEAMGLNNLDGIVDGGIQIRDISSLARFAVKAINCCGESPSAL
jgi:hypothetical protein